MCNIISHSSAPPLMLRRGHLLPRRCFPRLPVVVPALELLWQIQKALASTNVLAIVDGTYSSSIPLSSLV